MMKTITTRLLVLHSALLVLLYVFGLNKPIFIYLNNNVHFPLFWAHITILGDGYIGALLLLTTALLIRNPTARNRIIYVMLTAALTTFMFKSAFNVARPAAILPMESINITGPVLTRHSFPSGHSTTFFMYLLVFLPFCRTISQRMVLVLFSHTGALSRIMVGAHWPMDILAAFLNAYLAFKISVYLSRIWPIHWSERAETILRLLLLAALAGGIFYNTGYPGTRLFYYCLLLSLAVLIISYRKVHFIKKSG